MDSRTSTMSYSSASTLCGEFEDNSKPSDPQLRALSQPYVPSFPPEAPDPKWTRGEGFWGSFIAICVPLLLSALEGSVTNTALPTISEALNIGTKFTWVATAFLLASTVFQPLYGQLGDIWGRKYPMIVAVGVFAVGSAICGSAGSGGVLIFGRIVQGLGTGGIDLFAEMILCDIVPLKRRGPYLAMKHVAFAAGTTLGPPLGGVFAEHGWRWCFLINIPVCIISMFVIYFWLQVGGGIKMKDVKATEEIKRVDLLGTAVLTASVVMLLFALSTGGTSHSWKDPAIVSLICFGVAGFAGFAIFQRSPYCAYPVMTKDVFSNRTTNIAFTLTTIHGFLTYGFQFYLPVFFQAVKGSSPTQSGVEVLPTTLAIVVLAAAGGPLMACWGRYKPIHLMGFGSMALGLGLCYTLNSGTPAALWVAFQLIAAAGSGIVVSSMLPAVQVVLPDTTTGQSSASWAFLRGTGSLFGVAIPGAIFNARFAWSLPSISSVSAQKQLARGQAYQHATAEFVKNFESDVRLEIIRSYKESLRCVWILFAVLAGIGFILAWFEKEHVMRKTLDTAYGLKTPPKSAEQTPAPTAPGSPVMTGKVERDLGVMGHGAVVSIGTAADRDMGQIV